MAATTTTNDADTKMLDEPTLEKMNKMRLPGMVDAWTQQRENPEYGSMSFDERLGLLVDSEWLHRENNRMKRNLSAAKLRLSTACIEDVEYDAKRKLDKKIVRDLASCKWIELHQNVVITGKTGVGKTYLACALAHQACRLGFRVIYRRVTRLFHDLTLAHADGSYSRFLAKLAKAHVLVLDDWGMADIGASQRRDLNEIMDDRYGVRSTIITGQLPTEKWHDYLGDPTIADAICDRILSNAHRIKMEGPSRRKSDKGVG